MDHRPAGLRLVLLDEQVMRVLLAGDLDLASDLAAAPLPAYFLDFAWLWVIRADQIAADPESADWVARAVFEEATGEVVGHVGFHAPPDGAGMVEVAYSVDPRHRRRGLATRMVALALDWAASDARVTRVRASVSPDNVASRAVLAHYDFLPAGEQWDPEDGRELLFELLVRRQHPILPHVLHVRPPE